MSEVAAQYEAYPYPERDPADEKKRLIVGSPSHPCELDHYLFAGRRDWTKPFRALVAGGGTGDALIQLAQVLASAGRKAEIVYLDLSTASRRIAEARAEARGLTNIAFQTGSLLDAGDFGQFDYIDCCGVLHHLPEPQAGFDALSGALAPGGGIGLMVYAPYGRAGVYPLQSAFGRLLKGAPEERLAAARAIFARLPEGHPFRRNPHLGDHEVSDAGFYDLLLHSQDTPFTITELAGTLARAGLAMTGTPNGHLYDPAPFVGEAADLSALSALDRMALAEELSGAIRMHVVYAARADDAEGRVARPGPQMVPHLRGVAPQALAQTVAKTGRIPVTSAAGKTQVPVPKGLASVLARIDGRHTLEDIARAAGGDWFALAPAWVKVSEALTAYGILTYSGLYRR
ncbi:class I SAM-dependent methyltransferase [Roseibacterium sp. SDUM158016]|uniref:class I SAM-dependent methyltransferase n=1 Tax=Roseicyclus sediminis TaxID=2980997 RepID=UPI0021D39DAD|nr:class I SAM-dependent methyltransferase [Roseibacterium sp. SDUM158016]MCU4655131.1 class I SAM-dependent methyltransferase [Roseibacterium sp. SDUM158016]